MSRARRRTGDDGAATVLAVALMGVLLVVTTVLMGAAAILVGHRRAQAAADLSALAGAVHLEAPCTWAARVAGDNGALVTSCQVEGGDVRVRTEVTVSWGAQTLRLQAEARAGPAR